MTPAEHRTKMETTIKNLNAAYRYTITALPTHVRMGGARHISIEADSGEDAMRILKLRSWAPKASGWEKSISGIVHISSGLKVL